MKGLSLRKKLLIVTLAVMLIAGSITLSSPDVNNAKATITGDGFVFFGGTIMDYVGSDTNVVIPAKINDDDVTTIASAFRHNKNIKEITISEGISTIGGTAFFNCPNLEKITIPSTVTYISSGALASGEKLSQLILSEENTTYKLIDNIIYTADQTEIIQYIPASPETEPVIQASVSTVHAFAFSFAANITSINVPATLETIESGAFSLCPNLLTVTVDAENPNYKSIDGVLYSKDEKTVHCYPGNKSGSFYNVPSGVETLSPFALSGCKNVKTANIANSVTELNGAFLHCDTLKAINVGSTNPNYSSVSGLLTSKDKSTLLFYPAGKTDTTYTLPEEITTIGGYSFYFQTYLETLICHDSLASVEDSAFSECQSLKKLVINSKSTEFPTYANSNEPDMTIWGYVGSKAEIYARDNEIPFVAMGSSSNWAYTDIGGGKCEITAYLGADTDVKVPSVIDELWVTDVAVTTFEGCTDIVYITFYETIETIEASDNEGSRYIFQDCALLREVYLPASLTKLQTYTAPYKPFKGCGALVNVSVASGSSSFYDVDGVLFSKGKTLLAYPSGRTADSYVIPDGTTGISYTAFNNDYLKYVEVPGSVSSLRKGDEPTFKNNIVTVRLQEGVDEVEDVFARDRQMNVYFASTVNSISGFDYADVPHKFYVFDSTAPHLYAEEHDIEYILICIVRFDCNGGTTVEKRTVTSGSKIAEPSDVQKEGFMLTGWYTDEALTNKWDFNTDTVTSNMKLYAQWKEGYEIIYHMNGGTNHPDNPNYYVTGKTMFLKVPTKTGYTFDGWYTSADCDLNHKFEAIEATTKGTINLWADWWVISAPDNDDNNDRDDTGGSGGGNSNLSDEREPEISQRDFPDKISYMRQGQSITVTGKIYIKYANVEDISASYSNKSDKLYKYKDGSARLSTYSYSHTFEVGEYNYYTSETYKITLRLSTGEVFMHSIPIYKYNLVTEAVNAPKGNIYMNSDKVYELRTMAIASNSFDMINATYECITPEKCSIENNVIKPLAAGDAQIKTYVTLEDGTDFSFVTDFKIMDKKTSEPSELERELACPCCGMYCTGYPEDGIDPALLDLIQQIRTETDAEIYIVSGYRCEEYNKSIGGKPDSEHVKGRAADLWSEELTLDELYEICDRLNINGGVGRYPDHIHVDTRGAYIRWDETQED